jgi:cob(I)alamin adenosyltransferase
MKIYTKTGDAGTTGLFAGPRVSKCDPRIVAYGSVDELNSVLGVVLSHFPESIGESQLDGLSLNKIVLQIQSDLFSIGAELATPDPDSQQMRLLDAQRITGLELIMDGADEELPALTHFILPGGTSSAAYLHLARTVCRRAERNVVSLMEQPQVADYQQVLVYLNRLSDCLFMLARLVNHRCQESESIWQKSKPDSAS